MSRVLFTMYDVESVWEEGFYAEFGTIPGKLQQSSPGSRNYQVITSNPGVKPGTYQTIGQTTPVAGTVKAGTVKAATVKAAVAKAERGILAEAGHLAKRTGQLTLSTSKKGLKFLRRIGGRTTGATGRLTQRGLTGLGKGVASAGNVVGRGIRQVGVTIGRNPKVAGAVILGGAALGAGGYAYSRRNKRSNNSRYLTPATFNRRYR